LDPSTEIGVGADNGPDLSFVDILRFVSRAREGAKFAKTSAKKLLGIRPVPWRPSLNLEYFAAGFAFLRVFASSPAWDAGYARAEEYLRMTDDCAT
jgi:hypothetical protein